MTEGDLPPFLPWRELQRTLGPVPGDAKGSAADKLVAYFVEREGFYARLIHHEKAGRVSQEKKSIEQQLGHALASWRILNPRLTRAAMPLVEELLRCVASLEVRLRPTQPSGASVLTLLAPGRRPMGHWLREVGYASEAPSIAKLAKRLEDLAVLYKGQNKEDPVIKVDLLKKWSASQQMLMPAKALQPVLTGVPHAQRSQLEGRYFLARWLSFIVDLVCASTQGDPLAWRAAQEQVASRYTELYQLALTAKKA